MLLVFALRNCFCLDKDIFKGLNPSVGSLSLWKNLQCVEHTDPGPSKYQIYAEDQSSRFIYVTVSPYGNEERPEFLFGSPQKRGPSPAQWENQSSFSPGKLSARCTRWEGTAKYNTVVGHLPHLTSGRCSLPLFCSRAGKEKACCTTVFQICLPAGPVMLKVRSPTTSGCPSPQTDLR